MGIDRLTIGCVAPSWRVHPTEQCQACMYPFTERAEWTFGHTKDPIKDKLPEGLPARPGISAALTPPMAWLFAWRRHCPPVESRVPTVDRAQAPSWH